MLDKIEVKLVDNKGNYSIAHISYEGYVDMLVDHNIDMLHDALQSMANNYSTKGRMEISKKDSAIEQEAKRGGV